MSVNKKFGAALRLVRKQRGLTQEDFSDVSSRTYLSSLERGLKSPTLEKIEQLAAVLQIHPASLVALVYLRDLNEVSAFCKKIEAEVSAFRDVK